MLNPEGGEVVLGPFSNLYTLQNQVLSYIGIYDSMTNDEYSKKLKEDAKWYAGGEEAAGILRGETEYWKKYVKLLIEHQMCLRNKSIKCWSGGVGDDIHNVLTKVEGFVMEKAPEPIQKMVRRFASVISKGKRSSVTGCSSCGGTVVMSPSVANMGRAGKLNKITGG